MASALAAAPPPASAAPIIGVGEQRGEIFTDPTWAALGLRDTRLVVSWDVTSIPFERADVDGYLAAARAAGARVMVTFGHSRVRRRRQAAAVGQALPARVPGVPPALARRADVRGLERGQPLLAADLPQAGARRPLLRRPALELPACTVVAADVLDSPNMTTWLSGSVARARHKPRIWGLHNYLDANRFRTTGTRELLRAVRGDVWFTETGGLVARNNGSRVRLPDSEPHAARRHGLALRPARAR